MNPLSHTAKFALVISLLFGYRFTESTQAADANRDNLVGRQVSVSVDSTSPGYGIHVLTDGKWIQEGAEITQDYGHPDRLGNCGNSWVSAAESDVEHWVRIEWPKPVAVNQVEIWWTISKWYPRAFRLEHLSDGKWVAATSQPGWLAATEQRSVITIAPRETKSLRIVQAPGGSQDRGLMGLQEVLVFKRPGQAPGEIGVRAIAEAELRRLRPRPLQRNIGRLHNQYPGADRGLIWLADGNKMTCKSINDGNSISSGAVTIEPSMTNDRGQPTGSSAHEAERSAATIIGNASSNKPAEAVGIEWPVRHVIDGAAVFFSEGAPECSYLHLEVHDGQDWVPVRHGLLGRSEPEQSRVSWSFQPIATDALRVCFSAADRSIAVTELEVYRYLPASKSVWPDRLVKENRLEREILASKVDPSFESVAQAALSMIPAHALLGFKDTPHEIGVTWDGTLVGWDSLLFQFGEAGDRLADYRDTVRRSLIDGWRPGVKIEGRIEHIAVRETAFLVHAKGDLARPALLVRVELKNLADQPIHSFLDVVVTSTRPGSFNYADGCLLRDGSVVLLSRSKTREDAPAGTLSIDFALAPKAQIHLDFVHPRVDLSPDEALAAFGTVTFDDGLAAFRAYWDGLLAPGMNIDLPEIRINRLYKAVLAQIFINGDGDIMRYGSEPSVYSQNLYGVEEGFAMMALAFSGFGEDAQRYLDGTYMTDEFLKKVETYTSYPDRHQQYRNGLQPHYAIDAFRFSRDKAWITKHLPLIRRCAEWTIAEREKTIEPEDGAKPLHWGLLPKWSYGGDIAGLQCYPIYPNVSCWRGLSDTAWLMEELGDHETARRYTQEAGEYRDVIDRVIDTVYQRDRTPPFLPGRVYGQDPVGNDYYQLFMGCLLNLHPFEPGGERIRYITDFLEQDNRTFCLLPRFRRDVGPGGLDGLYGLGYILSKLHGDSIQEFLLGFYGFLAFNMDHRTFTSRETNLIYASDLHVRSKYPVPDKSDPIPCSSAVSLHFLRHMLVTEELAGPGVPSGNLLLLYGAPRNWLDDGEQIRVHNAPTHYGPISFDVVSRVDSGRIEARIVPPARNPCPLIKLRLRHPQEQPIASVRVDGKPAKDIRTDGELILLPAKLHGQKPVYAIEVEY